MYVFIYNLCVSGVIWCERSHEYYHALEGTNPHMLQMCLCMIVEGEFLCTLCVCVDWLYGLVCVFFFKVVELCYGMLSYVMLCYGWMHTAYVRVLGGSFIKFHRCDCIYGSEFLALI